MKDGPEGEDISITNTCILCRLHVELESKLGFL